MRPPVQPRVRPEPGPGPAATPTPAPTRVRTPEPAVAERPEPSPRTEVTRRSWVPVRPAVVSQGSAARFAERVAMRRRLLRDRIVLVVVGSLVAAALAWLLLLSPVLALRVDQVQVEGQGTVVDIAAVQAVVQAYDGVPLPRLDTVALRRSVLDVPGVRAAQVTREWPHGLLVTVVSREPVAAVPRDGGFALLDVEGVQVGRTDTAPEAVPVITVPVDDPGARAMTAVLTVLQQLPPELATQLVAASAENQDTVALELADGSRVEWGSADESALKARVLTTLRSTGVPAGVDVYDVSAPTLPITRS